MGECLDSVVLESMCLLRVGGGGGPRGPRVVALERSWPRVCTVTSVILTQYVQNLTWAYQIRWGAPAGASLELAGEGV